MEADLRGMIIYAFHRRKDLIACSGMNISQQVD